MVALKYNSFHDLADEADKQSTKYSKKDAKRIANFLMKHTNVLLSSEIHYNKEEYEDAYIRVFKLLNAFSLVTQFSEHYKAMFGSQFQQAIVFAEKIKEKLDELYDLKKNTHRAITESMPSVAPISLPDVLEQNNSNSLPSCDMGKITTATLYTELKSGVKSVLILDIRPTKDFERSHIAEEFMKVPINVINIPADIFKIGMSANVLASRLSPNDMQQYNKRKSFDMVVLVGLDENYEQIEVLKTILTYDHIDNTNKQMKILEEGYNAWAEAYVLSDNLRPIKQPVDDGLSNVNYDFDFDDSHSSDSRASKADLAEVRNTNTRPIIDRSSKVHAMQIYNDREFIGSDTKQRDINTLGDDVRENIRRKQEELMDRELSDLKLKNSNIIQIINDSEVSANGVNKESTLNDSPEQKPKIINHELPSIAPDKEEAGVFIKKKILPSMPVINRANKPKRTVRIFGTPTIGQSPGLTGLKNLGNTCYMNSILQCISNNSDLMEYFYTQVYRHDLNENHRTRGEVARRVAEVVKVLWDGRQSHYAAWNFKNAMGNFKTEYKSSEQQDSHEFLTFLMDWLHNDLNKEDSSILPDVESDSEMEKVWFKFRAKNKSQISKLFYGLQKSTVSCLACGEQSATYEPFSNLSLSIPFGDNIPLQKCIQEYLKGESISGWRCPKCKKEQPAERKTELCKLPVMLVIHLKRFSFHDVHSTKRTTLVKFPLDNLELSSFDKCKKSYSLYGVSNHYGTMESGHYTAFCKNYQYARWYRFDDHEVTDIPPERVETNAAYILFYSSNVPFVESS